MNIQIVDTPLRHAFITRETCRHDKIGDALGKILPYCLKVSTPVLEDPSPLCRYTRWGEADCDIEGGFFINGPVDAPIGTRLIVMPAGRAVLAEHEGPYDQLIRTHNAVMEFMQANSLEFDGPPWEHYVTDPTLVAPEELMTHVYVPVK